MNKQNQICANPKCGHDKNTHKNGVGFDYCSKKNCTCKKFEPKNQICKCGHEKGQHFNNGKCAVWDKTTKPMTRCTCKKFEAETPGRKIKKLMNDLESGKLKKPKNQVLKPTNESQISNQKGCGKRMHPKRNECSEYLCPWVCGKNYLCANCEPKNHYPWNYTGNHSPQEVGESHDSGDPGSNPGSAGTLSSNLLALRRYLPDNGQMNYWVGDNKKNKGIYVDLGAVMSWNKEAIKKLKAPIESEIRYIEKNILKTDSRAGKSTHLLFSQIIKNIDKIFGDKLSK